MNEFFGDCFMRPISNEGYTFGIHKAFHYKFMENGKRFRQTKLDEFCGGNSIDLDEQACISDFV